MVVEKESSKKDEEIQIVDNLVLGVGICGSFVVLFCLGTIIAIVNECRLINAELNKEVEELNVLSADIWSQLRSIDVDPAKLREKRQTYGGYGGFSTSNKPPNVYHQPSLPFRPRQLRPTPVPDATIPGNYEDAGGPPPRQWPMGDTPMFSQTKVPPGATPVQPAHLPFNFPPAQPPAPQKPKCDCARENKCPAGPPGPKGIPGPAGPTAPDGKDGVPGVAGESVTTHVQQYDKCFTCPQGPNGMPGQSGRSGMRGMRGARGMSGMPGRNGNPGSPGQQGPEGPVGEDGPQGEQGPAGENGTAGKGPKGPKGEVGPVGAPEEPGEPGIDGVEGPVGPSGMQGPQGDSGMDGEDGISGPPGELGEPGLDASYCPCPRRQPVMVNGQPQYLFGF